MITINANTKRGQMMIAGANRSEGRQLHDVYGTFSTAKGRAFQDCLRWCAEDNGSNFRIVSHNTFGFSVAWDTEWGLRIETPQNSYLVA